METVRETDSVDFSQLLGEVFGSIKEQGLLDRQQPLSSSLQHVEPTLQDSVGENEVYGAGVDRFSGWAQYVLQSNTFRRRILHDIATHKSQLKEFFKNLHKELVITHGERELWPLPAIKIKSTPTSMSSMTATRTPVPVLTHSCNALESKNVMQDSTHGSQKLVSSIGGICSSISLVEDWKTLVYSSTVYPESEEDILLELLNLSLNQTLHHYRIPYLS